MRPIFFQADGRKEVEEDAGANPYNPKKKEKQVNRKGAGRVGNVTSGLGNKGNNKNDAQR